MVELGLVNRIMMVGLAFALLVGALILVLRTLGLTTLFGVPYILREVDAVGLFIIIGIMVFCAVYFLEISFRIFRKV